MADQEYAPGAGDVKITLDGAEQVLKPSLGAALKLSRTGDDGPRRLGDRVLALNLEAIAFVIAAGLNISVDNDLTTKVYRTGAINLFGPCLRFLRIIHHGGREPINKEDEETPGGPPPSS